MSDEGDVLYVFPKDYRSKLATKSLRIKLEPFLEKAKVVSLSRINVYILEGNSIQGKLFLFSLNSLELNI